MRFSSLSSPPPVSFSLFSLFSFLPFFPFSFPLFSSPFFPAARLCRPVGPPPAPPSRLGGR
ncbi:hypothetical protein DMH03_41840, partial [Amycolatopsis sp. WAC 01376]